MTKAYHNGPISDQQRKPTDRVCCVLFLTFNFIMLSFAVYAWTSSNFAKLSTPYDPDGKGCGVDYLQYPYIFFASPHPDSLFVTTCVKKCPINGDQIIQCKTNSVVKACASINNADNTKAVQIYDTTPMRGVICMPTQQKIQSQVIGALGTQTAQQKFASLSRTWVVIIISIPIAILLSMILLFLMRLTAGFFIYVFFGLSTLSLIILGLFFIISPTNQYANILNSLFHNHVLSTILGIICLLFGIVIGITVICYRHKLKLASLIVKVSTRFVNQNIHLMLVQIAIFFAMVLFVVLWCFEGLGFYSMGQPKFQPNSLPFQHFQLSWVVMIIGIVHIFYLFWVMVFFAQSGDFLVAGTVTSWYFLRQKPYKQSINRYFNFHFGSVCVGSFLIALFGFIKFLNQILTPKQQQQQGCLKTCRNIWNCCCYFCVNWVFQFVNNGAYTFIHLSGDSYCTSALQVLAIRLNDLILTGVVTILSVLFQILIRIGITAVTCLISYIIVKNVQPYKSQVHDTTLTMVIVGLLGFTISSFFVSLYSQAMQSISLCYLIDKQAGGKQDKCPEQLKDFLQQAKLQNHTLRK